MVSLNSGVGSFQPSVWNTVNTASPYRAGAASAKTVESSVLVLFRSQITVSTFTLSLEQGRGLSAAIQEFSGVPVKDSLPVQTGDTPAANQDLFGEDGYFGVAKTSKRIADFVLKGGGDNAELLKAGRQGVLQGLKEAQKAWGGTLPDICSQTIDAALKSIDDKIASLGESIIDTAV
ncbi:MAG: hydrogenase-4 component G [Pseudomonadota bacterium]